MSAPKYRFLLVSDMHYTTEERPEELKKLYPEARTSLASGNAFGRTQREKIEKVYADILAEHERSPLDGVFVLGDLSVDDYDYRNLPFNYCRKFKEECMDRLPCKAYALPGNHDSYPNSVWRDIFGYDRQYAVEAGDCVFLMADSFAGVPAKKDDPASGAPVNALDEEFIKESLEKYKGKKIFICTHFTDGKRITEGSAELIKNSADVVFLFRGHTHVNSVAAVEEWGKPLIDIGGYGYMGQRVNGHYDFNIYDPKWAWGYQILEIYPEKILTYHIKPAMKYIATNGVFEIAETEEGRIEVML